MLAACHFETTVVEGETVYRACGYAKKLGRWLYDDAGGFYMERPDVNGACPAGLLQVNRLYNPSLALSRTVSSQRYVTSDSAAKDMIGGGWVLLPTTMCARY